MTATQTKPRQQTPNMQMPPAGANALAIRPRLDYPGEWIAKEFDVNKTQWHALVDAVFPSAKSAGSIALALAYCKARSLDPFKRVIHIVPIWDSNKRQYVETIWPGIGELRTTAFRTGHYAGRDATQFGEMDEREWQKIDKAGKPDGKPFTVEFPEWAQSTVYRMVGDQRVAFAGPVVYWLETYASTRGGAPNEMWQKRPRGQLEKCAEAAALRAAFPEEIGDQMTDDETGIYQAIPTDQRAAPDATTAPPRPTRAGGAETSDAAPDAPAASQEPAYEVVIILDADCDENSFTLPAEKHSAKYLVRTSAQVAATRGALDEFMANNAAVFAPLQLDPDDIRAEAEAYTRQPAPDPQAPIEGPPDGPHGISADAVGQIVGEAEEAAEKGAKHFAYWQTTKGVIDRTSRMNAQEREAYADAIERLSKAARAANA